MSKKKALFTAYRMAFRSLESAGVILMAEARDLRTKLFNLVDEKNQAVYHRRPLSPEQCASLNERQREYKAALEANHAKLIELGREIASLAMEVDANTTPDDRINEFNLELGTFDHGVASTGHLIFCGAFNAGKDGFDVIHHALALACRDYRDNIGVGPQYAAIEHVACENLIHWLTDTAAVADHEVAPGEYLYGSSYSVRECIEVDELDDTVNVTGAHALPIRNWSALRAVA